MQVGDYVATIIINGSRHKSDLMLIVSHKSSERCSKHVGECVLIGGEIELFNKIWLTCKIRFV